MLTDVPDPPGEPTPHLPATTQAALSRDYYRSLMENLDQQCRDRCADAGLGATDAALHRRAVIGGHNWLTHAPPSYFARDKLTVKGPRANTDVGAPVDATYLCGGARAG